MERLQSTLDASINLVEEQLTGFIESRYVRRSEDYFIAYLSSQTGCNRGCRFCHLTATKQTKDVEDLTARDMVEQAERVFKEYYRYYEPDIVSEYRKRPIQRIRENDFYKKGLDYKPNFGHVDYPAYKEYMETFKPAKAVHFNFMARGEPLSNLNIQGRGYYYDHPDLFQGLHHLAQKFDLYPKFNISTIMPRDMELTLSQRFSLHTPTIYYSIYSLNADFRRRWIPNAMDPIEALKQLGEYQAMSRKIVKFHGAFIKDQNDDLDDVMEMCRTIKRYVPHCEFNIVRYNPYSTEQGEETSEDQMTRILAMIRQYMPCKIIPRVGMDVKASCGMFVE